MEKQAYHHGNLRDALLEATREALAEGGVDGVSLRKVAERAGVSATALYSHFKDKRELLAVLASQGFNELVSEMEAEVTGTEREGNAAGLVALARGYVKFATSNPALFQLMFGPALGELSDNPPQLQEASARAYTLMQAEVSNRMEELGMAQQTPVAAAGAWALVHGLSCLLNDGRISAEKLDLPDTASLAEQVCALLDFS